MEQSLNSQGVDAVIQKLESLETKLDALSNEVKTHTPKDLLTSKEAARYLNVKMDWFNKLCSQEQISYTKPGGKNRVFKKSDLDKYIERNLRTSYAD